MRSCLTCCSPTAWASWRSSDGTNGSAKLTAATAGPASSVTCGFALGTGEVFQILHQLFLLANLVSAIFPVCLQKHFSATTPEDYQWLCNGGSTTDASGAAQTAGDPPHPEAPEPSRSARGQLGPHGSGSQRAPAGDGLSLDIVKLAVLLLTTRTQTGRKELQDDPRGRLSLSCR